MGNRKLPFGYEVQFGEVVVAPAEAGTVKWIFQQYIVGSSYSTITKTLSGRGVLYEPGKEWNKNMVARILKNTVYTGRFGYPPIIDKEYFEKVQRSNPTDISPWEKDATKKAIRVRAKCAGCGGSLKCKNNRWTCTSCKDQRGKVTHSRMVSDVSGILKALAAEPGRIQRPPGNVISKVEEVKKLNEELGRTLEAEKFDGVKARELAFALAAARMEEAGRADYETYRLQHQFTTSESSNGLDIELLRQTVAAIQVGLEGTIHLWLKNGQLVGKESLP